MGIFFGQLLVVLLPGCTPDPSCWTSLDDTALASPRQVAFDTVGEAVLGDGGLGEAVDVALGAGAGTLALRVSDPGGQPVCVQLHEVVDPAGAAWITPPASLEDYGSYCRSCPQRVSVGVGAGFYVLPSGDPPPPSASLLQVRAAARECSTFLPARPGEYPARLRIDAVSLPEVEETREGVVTLEVAITSGSAFHEDAEPLPAGLAEVLDQVSALLRPGHLSVRAVRVRRVDVEDPLEFERGDHSALLRLLEALHTCGAERTPDEDGHVPLVLAGCLRLADPVQQRTSEPEGFVPSIPGGLGGSGQAHGIFIRGRSCQGGSAPISWPPEYLARLIAHELGHVLGLYHSVEEDGSTDLLDDTGPDNLMAYRPSTAAGAGFSASQLRVMRRHPVVRWAAP